MYSHRLRRLLLTGRHPVCQPHGASNPVASVAATSLVVRQAHQVLGCLDVLSSLKKGLSLDCMIACSIKKRVETL